MRSAALATARMPVRVALAMPPRLRRRLGLLLLLVAALGALYWFWFRESSFAAVEDVTVTGLTTADAPRIRRTLENAAAGMSTLAVDRAELEAAVAGNPLVHALRVVPDFPHALRIEVVENRPVAVLRGGDAVTAEGKLIPDLPVNGQLPLLRGPQQLAVVLAAAPQPLLERMRLVRQDREKGVVVAMRSGPEIVIGEPESLRVKWDAATRVLADGDSRGASYIDVSIPERPVAGGLAVPTTEPVSPAGETIPATPQNPQPSVEALPQP